MVLERGCSEALSFHKLYSEPRVCCPEGRNFEMQIQTCTSFTGQNHGKVVTGKTESPQSETEGDVCSVRYVHAQANKGVQKIVLPHIDSTWNIFFSSNSLSLDSLRFVSSSKSLLIQNTNYRSINSLSSHRPQNIARTRAMPKEAAVAVNDIHRQ